MSKPKGTEEIPSDFNLKCYVVEWYLLQIYGSISSLKGKGNVYDDTFKKRVKQGGTILGVILIINIINNFLPTFSVVFTNILRLTLLASVPVIAIWLYFARKRDMISKSNLINPPISQAGTMELYQLKNDAIYVNYYNRGGYWYHLNWEDIIYAEVVPTQLYLGEKTDKILSRERNKVFLNELNERFDFVNDQVEEFPFEKLVVQNGMISIKFVTQDEINLLPIPPSWITEGIVEDLLIFIDGKINERFYISPIESDNIKEHFPVFFDYVNQSIITREKTIEEFNKQLGFSKEDIKNSFKEMFNKIKGKLRGGK